MPMVRISVAQPNALLVGISRVEFVSERSELLWAPVEPESGTRAPGRTPGSHRRGVGLCRSACVLAELVEIMSGYAVFPPDASFAHPVGVYIEEAEEQGPNDLCQPDPESEQDADGPWKRRAGAVDDHHQVACSGAHHGPDRNPEQPLPVEQQRWPHGGPRTVRWTDRGDQAGAVRAWGRGSWGQIHLLARACQVQDGPDVGPVRC